MSPFHQVLPRTKFLLIQNRDNPQALFWEYKSFLSATRLHPGELNPISSLNGTLASIDLSSYAGILIGGSPFNISDPDYLKSKTQTQAESNLERVLKKASLFDIPIFGICYGMGVAIRYYGGRLGLMNAENLGSTEIELNVARDSDPVTYLIEDKFPAITGHKESIIVLPENAEVLATGEQCRYQLIKIGSNQYFSQFHPESDLEDLKVKMQIYRDHGYFDSKEKHNIIKVAARSDYKNTRSMLKNFVDFSLSYSRTDPVLLRNNVGTIYT